MAMGIKKPILERRFLITLGGARCPPQAWPTYEVLRLLLRRTTAPISPKPASSMA